MRAFAWFIGLIGVGFIGMALLSYPAWVVVHPHVDAPFHRIASRIGMITLLIGFVLIARRLQLNDRTSLGYGIPRPLFLREMGLGFAISSITMLPLIGVMVGLDLRDWKGGVAPDAGVFAGLVFEGVLRGFAVALIEETFLRGAMFTGIARESGTKLAILLTALLYASTHFFARYRVAAEDVSSSSGFDMVAGVLHTFSDPLFIADAFLALFAVGVVLGIVRARTGNIAACIGLHAGWVFIITFVRETSMPREGAKLGWMLSEFDGVVGWLLLVGVIGIGVQLSMFYKKRASVVR